MTVNFKLIAGLGNPGKEYATTRHNAGAWWLQKLCDSQQIELQPNNKFHGLYAKIAIDNCCLYCLMPLTYMNLSGKAIASIANYYDLSPESILVVHDDLDLPPGMVRLKHGGGHGGHNGLKDIISALQSKDFYRLRLGIGHPGNKDAVTNYVTQQPSKSDKIAIDAAIVASLNVLPKIIQGELTAAINCLHSFSA
jgi:PTH1 family peptidyl-tRNA hydrolase